MLRIEDIIFWNMLEVFKPKHKQTKSIYTLTLLQSMPFFQININHVWTTVYSWAKKLPCNGLWEEQGELQVHDCHQGWVRLPDWGVKFNYTQNWYHLSIDISNISGNQSYEWKRIEKSWHNLFWDTLYKCMFYILWKYKLIKK